MVSDGKHFSIFNHTNSPLQDTYHRSTSAALGEDRFTEELDQIFKEENKTNPKQSGPGKQNTENTFQLIL